MSDINNRADTLFADINNLKSNQGIILHRIIRGHESNDVAFIEVKRHLGCIQTNITIAGSSVENEDEEIISSARVAEDLQPVRQEDVSPPSRGYHPRDTLRRSLASPSVSMVGATADQNQRRGESQTSSDLLRSHLGSKSSMDPEQALDESSSKRPRSAASSIMETNRLRIDKFSAIPVIGKIIAPPQMSMSSKNASTFISPPKGFSPDTPRQSQCSQSANDSEEPSVNERTNIFEDEQPLPDENADPVGSWTTINIGYRATRRSNKGMQGELARSNLPEAVKEKIVELDKGNSREQEHRKINEELKSYTCKAVGCQYICLSMTPALLQIPRPTILSVQCADKDAMKDYVIQPLERLNFLADLPQDDMDALVQKVRNAFGNRNADSFLAKFSNVQIGAACLKPAHTTQIIALFSAVQIRAGRKVACFGRTHQQVTTLAYLTGVEIGTEGLVMAGLEEPCDPLLEQIAEDHQELVGLFNTPLHERQVDEAHFQTLLTKVIKDICRNANAVFCKVTQESKLTGRSAAKNADVLVLVGKSPGISSIYQDRGATPVIWDISPVDQAVVQPAAENV
ncbi:hypothetical protein N431DRAFT_465292 [Stipitochalara longipes BDJ]|nr:hypothetical protein N431DRAFT_465292 [Stipitochalara longipes BDJ]